jgi:putative flippase GtrA
MTAPAFAETIAAPADTDVSAHERSLNRATLREFLRYFACSALALGVDAGLYALLMAAGWDYATAAAAGFMTGLLVVYVLSVRLVFSTRRMTDTRREFATFAGIGVFGLLVTELLLWALIEHFGAGAMVARMLTAGVVFVLNFTLRKVLLFTSPASRGPYEQ